MNLAYMALTLWYLGYPEQALHKNHKALTLTRELSHSYSPAFALTASTWNYLLPGEYQAAQARAEELIAFATEQRIPYWAGQLLTGQSGC